MNLSTTFSVVIPTYKRTKCLKETLLSILLSREEIKEIILVDQSDSKIAEEIRAFVEESKKIFQPCELTLIHSEQPSLTAARNIGLKKAASDWVIFCDDDVIWPEGIILKLKDRIIAERDLVLIGGLNYEGKGDTYTEAVSSIISSRPQNLFVRFLRWLVGRGGLSVMRGHASHAVFGKFPEDMNGIRDTEWAMGFFFAIDRSFVMSQELLFDENLKKYAYAEDFDFTHRLYRVAKRQRKRCIFSPEIGVWHKATREWRISPLWQQYALFMNRVYIGEKIYRNFIEYAWFTLRMVIAETYNFLLSVKDRNWKSFLKLHFEYFKNHSRIKKEGWYFLLERGN
ncbi:glycosyltransferase family 2 protein [Candidatus Spyradosoma sp. SGI.093]|uniref:glycosyltransferase family 2 protein n=1 Tax=Candidatus Spyradosoma sp. SGI.093 TaxID=3420583 RepID=UPI003D0405BE